VFSVNSREGEAAGDPRTPAATVRRNEMGGIEEGGGIW
jgi:hypothetical protein